MGYKWGKEKPKPEPKPKPKPKPKKPKKPAGYKWKGALERTK